MEKTKTLNSTQIARLAGVSRSTVSKVVNNYPDIPEETKNKVRAVIAEHRYTPNVSARVLRGKPQRIIALYVYASALDVEEDALCRLGSPYVMGVISSFIAEAKSFDHRMMIELLKHGEDEQEVLHQIRSQFESKSIAAAIFLGVPDDVGFIDCLVDDNYPVVAIDRNVRSGRRAISIFTDDERGGYLATSHLLGEGYRQIAFVSGDSNKCSAHARAEGYRRAMREQQLPVNIIAGGFSEKYGALAVEYILSLDSVPDAVVCASDAQAYGFIHELHKRRPELLGEIGIVGFDNSFFNDFQQPKLSSVKVDFSLMARSSINALLDSENYKEEAIPVELVIRESSLKRTRR